MQTLVINAVFLMKQMQFLMKLLRFCDCCIQKSSESYRRKLMKPQQLFRRLLLTQRQTTDWEKLEDEHFRISASHLLSTIGNHVSFGMCLEMSCFQGKNPRKLTMFQRFTIIAFSLIKLGRRFFFLTVGYVSVICFLPCGFTFMPPPQLHYRQHKSLSHRKT